MRIAILSSETDNAPQVVDVSWAELVESLTTFRRTLCHCHTSDRPFGKPNKCPLKSGPAWSPVIVEGRRCNENVRAITAAVFDVDHVTMAELCALCDRLEAGLVAFVIHSSHSHRPPGAPVEDVCARIVMPLGREVQPGEWRRVREALMRKYGIPGDPRTKDVARLYFLPSAPDGAEVIGESFEGGAIYVDGLLAEAEAPSAPPREVVPAAVPTAPAAVPTEAEGGPVDLAALKKRLRSVDREDSRELVGRILKGEPLAEEGARDDTLNRAVSICACALPPETPDEAILELLRPSVLAMPGDPPQGDPDWLRLTAYKLSRARDRRQANDAAREQWAADLRARLRVEATGGTAAAAPPKAPGLAVLGGADPGSPSAAEPSPAPNPSSDYTDAQLEEWGLSLGCSTLADLSRRMIIQRGKAFWVFVGGKYQAPITDSDLAVSLPRDLSRAAFVELYRETKDGNLRPVKVSELLAEHATVARDVQASLSLQRSFYDATTQTFHEAVRPLRQIEPREDPDIQSWLELLGGDQSAKLLDWVATVSRLDRQTCALYFDGRKGVGKNLLAWGLARLWTTGGPAELARALQGFNDVLTQCPLLFADEALPPIKGITSELRRLVGSTGRNLNRKFLPTCNLDGAIRLILAGNNDRLLDTGEDLSSNDLDAVAGRFLYIRPDPMAADFLQALGGPPVLKGWIEEDKIAAHALHLATVRKVDESGRFLVEGEAQEFHSHLATGSGLSGAVCEWLVRYLDDPGTLKIPSTGILVGEGEVWANTTALAGEVSWHQRVPSVDVPSASRIGKALRNLALDVDEAPPVVAVGGREQTFHRLKPALLLSWAARAQVGDLGALRARIAGPNTTIADAKARRGGVFARPALEVVPAA